MTQPPFPQWQDAASDATFSDPAECARKASSFERRIRVRNFIEYAAGALVTVLFGSSAIAALGKGEWAIAAALGLVLAGVAIVLWNLHRRASNLERRAEDPCLVHLKRQYSRQYEALRSVPLWYVGPFLPGSILLFAIVAYRVAEVSSWANALEGLAIPALITFGLFAAVALANVVAARSLKRKIEEIDALA